MLNPEIIAARCIPPPSPASFSLSISQRARDDYIRRMKREETTIWGIRAIDPRDGLTNTRAGKNSGISKNTWRCRGPQSYQSIMKYGEEEGKLAPRIQIRITRDISSLLFHFPSSSFTFSSFFIFFVNFSILFHI